MPLDNSPAPDEEEEEEYSVEKVVRLFFDIFLPYLSNWYTWGFWPNLSMLAVRPPFQRLPAYGIASTLYVVLLYSIINELP